MVLNKLKNVIQEQSWLERHPDQISPERKDGTAVAFNSLTGQTLGKYQILEPLGRGGMAQVYRAYHPQLDRYVAVKILRWDLVDDESFLNRFQREAKSMAKIDHNNVVKVYAVAEFRGIRIWFCGPGHGRFNRIVQADHAESAAQIHSRRDLSAA